MILLLLASGIHIVVMILNMSAALAQILLLHVHPVHGAHSGSGLLQSHGCHWQDAGDSLHDRLAGLHSAHPTWRLCHCQR